MENIKEDLLFLIENEYISENDIADLFYYGFLNEEIFEELTEEDYLLESLLVSSARKASALKKAKRWAKSLGSAAAASVVVPFGYAIPAYGAVQWAKKGIENKKNGKNFSDKNLLVKRLDAGEATSKAIGKLKDFYKRTFSKPNKEITQ